MKKSKSGSTLLVTIIIFMFVTTVSFAFLSMVTSNYYGRVSESKRTQNLYGAESGLDTTYNIIAKTIEAANVYGNEKVEELKTAKDMNFKQYSNLTDKYEDKKSLYALYADIEYWKYYNGNLKEDEKPKTDEFIEDKIKEDNEDIDKLINKVFKDGFEEFIQNNLKTSIEDNEYIQLTKNHDGELETKTETLDVGNAQIYVGKKSTNTSVQKNKNSDIENAQEDTSNENSKIYTGEIVGEDTNSDNASTESDMISVKPQGNAIDVDKTLHVESGYDDNGRIQYDSYQLEFSIYNEENYPLTLTSEFETDSSEENTFKVGENLRVIEANYLIRVPNYDEVAFKESSANVGSDINELVGLTIGGDMYVNGVDKLNVNGDIFVQGKEFTGIMDKSNRTFEKYSGGIILNNEIGTKKKINFNNNVFSRGTFNLKNNVDVTVEGDLYARNIYAGNENNLSDNSILTVSKEAVIDNDLTVKATNTHIDISDFYGINDRYVDEGTKVRKSSSIIINDYKDNNHPEKLPSSVTISNKAYIMGVAHINTEDGYQTGESVAVKGNYKAYSNPDSSYTGNLTYKSPLQLIDTDSFNDKIDSFYNYWKDGVLDGGGVSLPTNTYSVGDTVSNGKVGYASPLDSNIETNVVKPKRMEYAKNIYTILKNKEYTEDELESLYVKMGEDAEDVSDLLNNISDYNLKDKINTGEKFAMFCSSKDKNIVIKGKESTGQYGDDDIVINAEDNKDVRAVIVTKGKVTIDGEVNFRGDIIAEGDLEVLGDSTVNIYYDEYVTQDIQNSNGEIFDNVFNKASNDNFGGETLDTESLNVQSNSSNFLSTKLWKIIQ